MEDREEDRGKFWIPAEWRGWALAFIAILGVAVTAGVVHVVLSINAARDRAIDNQSHSFEVIALTRSLGENLAQAEASLGRFVISTDKMLGRRYMRDWNLARQQIEALARQTRDNPHQTERVAALQRAYEARGEELSKVAIFMNYARHPQALTAYYDSSDSRALQRTDDLLTSIMSAERRLLQRRSDELEETVTRSNRIVAALMGLGVVLLGVGTVFGWGLVEAIAARKAADDEAADERARAVELEHAVAAATEQLRMEQADREAAEAKLQQSQKMDAIGQLTGGIAHDFNNMLAVVLGGIELAKRHSRSLEVRQHLSLAAEGADRAVALTRQLLAFARAEPIAPEAIYPPELIAGMAPLLDRTLGDGVRIVTRDSGMGWHSWTDRHQLENAILNLAVNARDAMDGRGTLAIDTGGLTLREGEVGSCPAGDYVSISVADTGHGMTPEVKARVFEPFFTTKPVGKGTGLGLSQVFGTIQRLDGHIEIDSIPNEGTTVTLYLPRHVGEDLRVPEGFDLPADEPSRETGMDILVVEDDPRVLRTTMAALVELGHRPVACADPLGAPARISAMPGVDLIMSDVLMPGQTGPEMVAGLRASRPDLKVLFVTGFAGDVQDATLRDARVLRKPYTLTALEAALTDVAGG